MLIKSIFLPTVIVMNDNSEIICADLIDKYRVRLEPEDFLNSFDAHLSGM
jgi:hypothetical protein